MKFIQISILFLLIGFTGIFPSSKIITSSIEETYPIIASLQAPESGTNAQFGTSVAVDGNIIVVGEAYSVVDGKNRAGRAYIFDATGNLLANLTAINPQKNAEFGHSVAVDGNLVVIGEPYAAKDGQAYTGRAYIFNITGDLLATLQAPTAIEGAEFGASVAIGGDIVIIGTYIREGVPADTYPSPPGTKSHVYIFNVNGTYQETLESPEAKTPSAFGVSVAIEENLIVIGEDHTTVNETSDAGKAYIFATDGTPLSTLQSSKPENWGVFGVMVDISSDIVIVGEPGASGGGKTHIFNTDGTEITTLYSPNPEKSFCYGCAVTANKNFLVVGDSATVDGKAEAGKAYIYDLNGTLKTTIQAPSPQENANFGSMSYNRIRKLSIDENILVIGEHKANIEDKVAAGRVYVFNLSVTIETPTTTTTSDITMTTDSAPSFLFYLVVVALISVNLVKKGKK